jgi:hypothetical protein
MFECYADGWVKGKYRHVIIYLHATQTECREEVLLEFAEVYGVEAEFSILIPVEDDKCFNI